MRRLTKDLKNDIIISDPGKLSALFRVYIVRAPIFLQRRPFMKKKLSPILCAILCAALLLPFTACSRKHPSDHNPDIAYEKLLKEYALLLRTHIVYILILSGGSYP